MVHYLIYFFSVLDGIKSSDIVNSPDLLAEISCLADFLVAIRCHSASSPSKEMPTVFYKLCSLLFDLRNGNISTDHLLNSLILLTCSLDFSEAISNISKSTLSAGCDKLFELIFTSHARNVCLIGEHFVKTDVS